MLVRRTHGCAPTGVLSEHVPHALDAGDEGVDLLLRVVEAEGGADRPLDAQPLHQRLRTMVPGADGDAEAVEQRAEVEVVDVADEEGDDAPLVRGFAEDAHALDGAQPFRGIARQFLLVGINLVHAQGGHIVERPCQGVRADVVGRTCLELVGQLVERRPLKADMLYHLPSSLVGRQPVEPLLLAVEHAHARRAVDLVPAEGIEVRVERLHVDCHVRHRLRPVDEYGHAVGMCRGYHLAHGIDRSQDVRHVGDAHQTGALVEERGIRVGQELAAVGHGDDADDDAPAVAQELPGDDVAVVLHDGDDDLVALAEEGFTERRSQEVDALGGSACEDNLARGAGVDELADGLACPFVQLGRLLGEEVDAAVHVGIDRVVLLGNGIDHAAWFLRGGAVVEIDERLAVDRAAENGEVFPYLLYIHSAISV